MTEAHEPRTDASETPAPPSAPRPLPPSALRAFAERARVALWPHRYWLAVALPLAAWFATPLWAARVLPLHDVPNHLARITAYHYLYDPRWNLSSFYERSMQLVPYVGHYYLVHLLTYVFRSVTTANLAFMTVYVLATPLCGLAFARATGRSPWLALFLLPLAVSFYFQWGFIAFCVGVMLMLPALASLYRLLDDASPRRAVFVGLWTVTLYLFHVLPWGAFGLYAILLCAIDAAHRRWRGPLLAAAAMAPSLVMMLLGVHQAHSIGYMGESRYEAVSDPPGKLLSRAVGMLNWFQSETRDDWILIGLIVVLVLLVVTDGGPSGERWRQRVRLPLAFGCFVALAFATPFWIKRPFNWWMINQRFLLPAACVAVFFPRGAIRGARLALFGVAVAAMLVLPRDMTRAYREFSRRAHPLIDLVRFAPMGATILVLHTPGRSFDDPSLAPNMTIWRELYNYPLVYRGGFDPYLYDDGFPIKRIASLPAPKIARAAELSVTPSETKFSPSMMAGWDYFIVPNDYLDAMPPDGAVVVRQAGEWSLYRNIAKR